MNSNSTDATLYRYYDACYSSQEFREKGELLRRYLVCTAPNPLSAGLLRASTLLLAESGLRRLASCPANAISGDWVTIPDPQSRSTVRLYNVWKDMSRKNIRCFLRILGSDGKLRVALRKIAPSLQIRSDMKALSFVGHCFEATFPAFCEPLLIGIVNGTAKVGYPTHIDLSLTRGWINKCHTRGPRFGHEYPVYFEQLRMVTAAMRRGELATLNFEIANDAWSRAAPKEIEALKILDKYTRPRPTKGEKFLRKRTHIRYLQAIPSVLELLSRPDVDTIFPEQTGACEIIRKFGSEPEKVVDFRKRVRVKQTVAEVNLVDFDSAREWYGLSTPLPSLIDTANDALRVLTILLFCGRRVRCLVEVKVKDFYPTEIFLRSSKVHSQRESWLPLSPIVGDTDLSFLASWLERMKAEKRHEDYLVDLALGEKVAKTVSFDEIQRMISVRLEENLGEEAPVNTHNPRRVFVSWFPIRCMLAEHRELKNHPLLIGHLQSDIFEDNTLDRLQKVVDDGVEDPLELCAKFIGNSLTFQLRNTYCRSWPILIALRAELERKRLGF